MDKNFSINNMKKVPLTAWEALTGVKLTRHCTGKMKGLWAINTSMKINPLCQVLARHEDYVCNKCYAEQYLAFRKSAGIKFEENFKKLTEKVFDIVPDIENEMYGMEKKIFRIEMYGDVYNENQILNYLLLAIFNPGVTFGWWTKHINMVQNVLTKTGLTIPANLSMVHSSIKLNVPSTLYSPGEGIVDHVFTVYTSKFADENNMETNCAAMSCYDCQRCYRKGGDFYINELLKKTGGRKI